MCLAGGGTWAPLLLTLVLCLRAGRVDGKNDNYQMSDICKKYFLRDLYRKIDGAVLTSQNERELNCAITFQTHSILQRFMLRFDQLQLDCNDHLYIYDGAHAVGSYKRPRSNTSINSATRMLTLDRRYKCSIMSLSRSLATFAWLAFVAAVVTADASTDACNRTKCRGPLEYYRLLGCEPVYGKGDDCCPIKYNCDRVRARLKTKCYVNGNEYNVGEKLKPEDSNPCDFECICREHNGIASFHCAGIDCYYNLLDLAASDCFRRPDPSLCCGEGQIVCVEENKTRDTCVVDGKTYLDGDYFEVKDEPNLICICHPGYEGKNVEPFCHRLNRSSCSPGFYNSDVIHDNCAPIFYDDQPPQTSCSVVTRCQEENDIVIHNHDVKSGEAPDEENVCLFGNLTMHLGDEISPGMGYNSFCVKCTCEVPPIPTCQHLSDNECDYSKLSIAID